jgi:hypothetical protein
MSNFPHKVYVPTGIAENVNYTQISGYCYTKINENVLITDGSTETDIIGSYDDCADCSSCECGKTIDFKVGGFMYNATNVTFAEKTISIQTSSTGWQEIAIESGQLNINPSTQLPDNNYNFKPVQIACYDRKIDMESGIHVSFDDRNAEISEFRYASGIDLYERQDLYNEFTTGKFGDAPSGSYLNQFDTVNIANTLRTIKFYNNCDFDCPTQNIDFRIRGKILTNQLQFSPSRDADENVTYWVYANCQEVPTTPGQIVECIPNQTGINISEYVHSGISTQYTTRLFVDSIDIINKNLLHGIHGSNISKQYSITGGLHFEEQFFGIGVPSTTFNYYLNNSGFYWIDYYGNTDYSKDIGQKYMENYNKPPNCFDSKISSSTSEFNQFYRLIGGVDSLIGTNIQGFESGDYYTGCYQSSEFIDGKYKNGTMMPMYWTGIITGNADGYTTFIDNNNAFPPNNWQTGFYVYQWYPSGDQSIANNITGFFGLMTGQYNNEELQKHYQSVALNQTPVNLQNKLKLWDSQSGYFPDGDAINVNASFILKFNEDSYKLPLQFTSSTIRHEGAGANIYEHYSFASINGELANLSDPEYQFNTFLDHGKCETLYQLTDRAASEHQYGINKLQNTTNSYHEFNISDDTTRDEKLKSITFQLSWNK